MTTRREKLRQATVEEIKSLAWDLLGQNQTVTIHSITRQMGMTAPAFYTYFKNREALMAELVRDALEAFYTALTAPFSRKEKQDISTVIFTTFVRYRQWAVTNPSAFSLFTGQPVSGLSADSRAEAELAERGYKLFFDLFERAEQEGVLILTEADFSSDYLKMLTAVKERLKLSADINLIHMVIQVTGLVHGMISMELSRRFDGLIENPELLFSSQLSDVLKRAGFINRVS
ncbi:MAG: TetR/AcrR family transcriptional regulator [Desulfobacterales bacterium]|nr:TetR/AcrR family transcriptional regulator [Desulfobacterales bacterium]